MRKKEFGRSWLGHCTKKVWARKCGVWGGGIDVGACVSFVKAAFPFVHPLYVKHKEVNPVN